MRFSKSAFSILFTCGIISATHFASSNLTRDDHQGMNLTTNVRLRRNYGYSNSYPETYEGYNTNHNAATYTTKGVTCCMCEVSGNGSPLLFFGLGSLLGLLFAMPLLLAGATTAAPTPAPPPPPPPPQPQPQPGGGFRRSRNNATPTLERSKRFDAHLIPMMGEEHIQNEKIQSIIHSVMKRPECIRHWFCEIYQHVHFALPKNEMKMVKHLVDTIRVMDEFKSCENLTANNCDKLVGLFASRFTGFY